MKRFDIKKLILKNKKAIVVVVISAFVIGGGVIFVKGKIIGNKQEVAFEEFEGTVKLEKGDINESIMVSGNVKSGEVSNVSSTIAAKVKAVNVKVGDIVKAGDVICILDDSDIVKEIENKKKAISEEKQVLQENYNKILNQINTLKNTQSQNSQNLSKAIELAKSNLDRVNAELNSYNTTLSNIKNTYDGVINSLKGKQNEFDNAQDNKKKYYEAWIRSGGSNESQEYKNYIEAGEVLEKKKTELEEAKGIYDFDSIASKYNEALSTYNEKVSARDNVKNQYDEAVSSKNTSLNSEKTELESLQANANEAYKQIQKVDNNEELKELEKKLNGTVLKAETSGKITELKVNVGSMTDGAVATIQSTDNLILSINIPEYDIQKVSIGMSASITSDTLKDKVQGELVRISPIANSGDSGSGFSAEIAIKNGQGMFIGTNAKAEIIISSKKDVILAPIDAVKDIDGNASVLVKQADGTFKEVAVTIGGKNDYYVEISGTGIKEGIEIKAIADEGSVKSEGGVDDTISNDQEGVINEGF
ncbi:HlyD family efflux transporter periplasmic adaptor subunit [Clostridium sp. D53t1_180928_C8]|uniref:HlyD family efflux transporter periplasmic adaptor subunit n=1 Tax=Clostridium sp. D53t1_180928_C8 TaxID=2787101 RepID=UPI0018AB5615|nr:HlyD family efflux transporter periplasmic adaptor subunit [Clostridium sp. D53t1_180928_C8]